MDFIVSCQCGRQEQVFEGSAGARLICECGRTIDVPNLAQLRASAGLPPIEPSLDEQVRTLLASGELPPAQCIGCGGSGDRISYNAECETAYIEGTGGISTASAMILGLAFGWIVFLSENRGGRMRGRDTYIPVPVRVCAHCRTTLLRRPYKALLNKLGFVFLILGIGAIVLHEWLFGGIAIAFGMSLRLTAIIQSNNYQQRLRALLATIPLYKRIFDKYQKTIVSCGDE